MQVIFLGGVGVESSSYIFGNFFFYLTFTFRNLADLDVLSKSDPMCVMFMKDIKTNTYYEVKYKFLSEMGHKMYNYIHVHVAVDLG